MARDYDLPRRGVEEQDVEPESLDALAAPRPGRTPARSGVVDVDETDPDQVMTLADASFADVSGVELSERVVPERAGEFTCSRCFLVLPTRLRERTVAGRPVCRDCA